MNQEQAERIAAIVSQQPGWTCSIGDDVMHQRRIANAEHASGAMECLSEDAEEAAVLASLAQAIQRFATWSTNRGIYDVWATHVLYPNRQTVWYGPHCHLYFEGEEPDGTAHYTARVDRDWMVEGFEQRCASDGEIIRALLRYPDGVAASSRAVTDDAFADEEDE